MEYGAKSKIVKKVYSPKPVKVKGEYTEWHVFDQTKWAVKTQSTSK